MVSSRKWPSISNYRAAVRTQSPKLEMIDSLFQPQPNSEDTGIIRLVIFHVLLVKTMVRATLFLFLKLSLSTVFENI